MDRIFASIAKENEIGEILDFYKKNKPTEGLSYPKDINWIKRELGSKSLVFGVARFKGSLIGAMWIAVRKHRLYFILDDSGLTLKDGGIHSELGGTLVAPSFRGRLNGVPVGALISGISRTYWLSWSHARTDGGQDLWVRTTGKRGLDGKPLFWSLVGEKVTGLPYREPSDEPFGSSMEKILQLWPSNPIPLNQLPKSVIEFAGSPDEESAEKWFPLWGCKKTNQLTVKSLSSWHVCKRGQIHAPEYFTSVVEISMPFKG